MGALKQEMIREADRDAIDNAETARDRAIIEASCGYMSSNLAVRSLAGQVFDLKHHVADLETTIHFLLHELDQIRRDEPTEADRAWWSQQVNVA